MSDSDDLTQTNSHHVTIKGAVYTAARLIITTFTFVSELDIRKTQPKIISVANKDLRPFIILSLMHDV